MSKLPLYALAVTACIAMAQASWGDPQEGFDRVEIRLFPVFALSEAELATTTPGEPNSFYLYDNPSLARVRIALCNLGGTAIRTRVEREGAWVNDLALAIELDGEMSLPGDFGFDIVGRRLVRTDFFENGRRLKEFVFSYSNRVWLPTQAFDESRESKEQVGSFPLLLQPYERFELILDLREVNGEPLAAGTYTIQAAQDLSELGLRLPPYGAQIVRSDSITLEIGPPATSEEEKVRGAIVRARRTRKERGVLAAIGELELTRLAHPASLEVLTHLSALSRDADQLEQAVAYLQEIKRVVREKASAGSPEVDRKVYAPEIIDEGIRILRRRILESQEPSEP